MDLQEIQLSLAKLDIEAWLFYDFHHRDPLAYRILDLPENLHTSRRWFYLIPRMGTPKKIVSMVEDHVLDSLPGEKHIVLSWKNLHATLKSLLSPFASIAMNYSPMGDIPYVSLIDAGTMDLIRNFGIEVISAQALIQQFEGIITPKQFTTHEQISPIMHEITQQAFDFIGAQIRTNKTVTELDVRDFIQERYKQHSLITDSSPAVAINRHAADPHFNPENDNAVIKPDDLVLIDSWAKLDTPSSVYYDFTQMAFVGDKVPQKIQKVWEVVKSARDKAIAFEKQTIENNSPCFGWKVDQVARDYMIQEGFGKYFKHRLGHSIGQEVHGNAVHLDSLETRDTREIVPGVLHSVEPGIYMPEENLGIRSEVNVYITPDNKVQVTGPLQEEIYRIQI